MNSNAYLLAVSMLIDLIVKLVATARKNKQWSADEQAQLRAKWEAGFGAAHWKPKAKR